MQEPGAPPQGGIISISVALKARNVLQSRSISRFQRFQRINTPVFPGALPQALTFRAVGATKDFLDPS